MQDDVVTQTRRAAPDPGSSQLDALQEHRLLRLPQVQELVPLSSSKIYELIQQDAFPRPIRISKQCVAWPLRDVLSWLEERRMERDSEEPSAP